MQRDQCASVKYEEAGLWALNNFGGAELGDQRRSKDSSGWRRPSRALRR